MRTSMAVLTLPAERGNLQKRGVWAGRHPTHTSSIRIKGQEGSPWFTVKAMDPEARSLRFIPALPYASLWDDFG